MRRWRAILRSPLAAFIAAGAGASTHPRSADAQIPPSIAFRVPKAPTVAVGDSGAVLAYELHITNLTNAVATLKRVDVLSAADSLGTPLLTLSDSVLLRSVTRPGVNLPTADRLQIGGGSAAFVFIWVPVNGSRPPATVIHRLTFQRSGADTSAVLLGGAPTAVDRNPARIGAPLRGEWLAVNGNSNAAGHRRTALALNGVVANGQRFGLDLLQVDEAGRTFVGDSTKNTSYHAYGEEVRAVGDGIVVATKDSIPENVPRGPVARAVPITLATVGGNHIVVDMGEGHFAFFAHLQPGSLRVRLGDRVKRGQVIGLVGNSGNSTEPHLHFHLVDGVAAGTSTLGAEGIPYALPSLDLIGRCQFGAAGIRCTRFPAITLKDAMPMQNQLVRFPDR